MTGGACERPPITGCKTECQMSMALGALFSLYGGFYLVYGFLHCWHGFLDGFKF